MATPRSAAAKKKAHRRGRSGGEFKLGSFVSLAELKRTLKVRKADDDFARRVAPQVLAKARAARKSEAVDAD